MLSRRGCWLASLAVALLAGVLLVPAASAAGPPPGCEYVRGAGNTVQLVCQTDNTQPGSTTDPKTEPPPPVNGGGSDSGGGSAPTGPQTYPTYDQVLCLSPPTAEAPLDLGVVQGTRSPTAVVMMCSSGVDGGPPFYFWSTPAAAAPPPPTDLVALSRKARAAVGIPQFTLEFGPDSKRLAVNMQTTFTAVPNRSMNLAGSASDRGITVTVTGRLVGMAWSPGEPVQCTAGDPKAACSGGRAGPVNCDGTTCQYTYRWMSSPARTGGAPVWTVTATATWQFTYTTTGTGPTTGAATATWSEPMPAGTAAVSMGEWSTAGGYEG